MKLKLSLSGLALLLLVACEPEFSKDIGGEMDITPKVQWRRTLQYSNGPTSLTPHVQFSNTETFVFNLGNGAVSAYVLERETGQRIKPVIMDYSIITRHSSFTQHDSAFVVTGDQHEYGIVRGFDLRTESFDFEHTFSNNIVRMREQGDSCVVFYNSTGLLHWDWINTQLWTVNTIGAINPTRIGTGTVRLNDVQFKNTADGAMVYLLYTDDYAGVLAAYNSTTDSVYWRTAVDLTRGRQMEITSLNGRFIITAGSTVSGIDPINGEIAWQLSLPTPQEDCGGAYYFPIDFTFVHDGDYFVKRPCNVLMRIEPSNGSILYEVPSIHGAAITNFSLTPTQLIICDIYGKVGIHDLATGRLNRRSIFMRELDGGPFGPINFDDQRSEMIFMTTNYIYCTAIPDLIQP